MVCPCRYEIADTAGVFGISVSDIVPHCRYKKTFVPADTGAFFCIRADTKRVLDQSSITVGKSFPRDMLRPPFETGLVHTGQIEKMFANQEKYGSRRHNRE